MVTPSKILETARPVEDITELKALVSLYYDVQKFRLRGNNRVKALQRGDQSSESLQLPINQLKSIEDGIAKNIAKAVEDEPAADWLLSQRGIGPTLAGAIIASGLDPQIDKPSAWWRYAGVGVVDGKNQRKRRGEKRNYNGFLRRTLYVIISSFLKSHNSEDPDKFSFYADLYYTFKKESERQRPELSSTPCPSCKNKDEADEDCEKCHGTREVGLAIHHHSRAIMLTERVFLTHLQLKWRAAIGLTPPRFPYIVEKEPGIHKMIEAPGP